MATRSTIAIEHQNGTVDMIYCHWDGYLEHNGHILIKHYQDWNKVEQLILLGDLSSLGTEIGEEHDFDKPYNGCTFYGRDRKEEGTSAHQFDSFENYRVNHQYEDYEYIYRCNGQWYVSQQGRCYEPLEDAIMEHMAEVA